MLHFCNHRVDYLLLCVMQEVKESMCQIKATQNDIQGTLKCIEVILCSEDGTRVRGCTPRSGDTVKLEGHDNKSTPSVPNSMQTKRKAEPRSSIGLHLNQVLTLSGDDDNNASKKLCHSLPAINLGGGMVPPCKPKIPHAWTQV